MNYYVVIEAQNVTDSMLMSCNCTNISGARHNILKDKVILKFDIANHASFLGMQWLTKEEAKTLMDSSEWSSGARFISSALSFLGLK